MSETTLSAADLDTFRGWIGREEHAADVVGVDLVRKFQATFDRPADPLQTGDVAPRLIHFCLAQPAAPTAQLGEDGHPQRGGFLPPVPLPRRMWAGGALTFHGDLRVGDAITRTSRIADVAVKEGRTGVLCFVTVNHTIAVDNEVRVEERQDIVYRGTEGGAPSKAPPAAASGEHRRAIDPSPPFLFRYSALTFNAHRIHYDRRYATGVEGYPGLVVHGPVQATLLMNFATDVRGTPPARFSFRSVSPLFDNDPVLLHARKDGDSLKLWTARPDGPEAMVADAAW
ncbi:MAG: MaoC family dehydratase N-terminal domain-containing protein [Pseudolabrys sp.]|nr:MaoC family dehydratase N-terminal domain-containing protein [Pseudolabrys sp.]MCW5684404.1 MaoC family dehydratase N-terminal domain-containing protein [Pseudolabrys sp.]